MSTISVRPLCPELVIKAQNELNETPKKLEEGIAYLKEWIAKQPHLRARTDDQWLAAFLRGCKYSIERAKDKFDLFYTMRSIAPEMTALKYWDPKFKEILRNGVGVILPKRENPDGPIVSILRTSQYDGSKFTPMDIISVSHAVQMISHMENDAFMVAGIILILDLTGLNISHIGQVTPTIMRKVIVHCQDASPIRLKEVHFMGMPTIFQGAFKMGLQFLNDKNRSKVRMYDPEELHKYVSKDVLPVEYGGNGGPTQEIVDYWVEKVASYDAFLQEDLQYGTDETKRSGTPKTAESLFGVDGFFRQLDFD